MFDYEKWGEQNKKRKEKEKVGRLEPGDRICACSVQFFRDTFKAMVGLFFFFFWQYVHPHISPHRSVQRKKLLFLGCSVIFTPWLLPCGLLPSWKASQNTQNKMVETTRTAQLTIQCHSQPKSQKPQHGNYISYAFKIACLYQWSKTTKQEWNLCGIQKLFASNIK